MKRLYENIEDIHITGSPAELSTVVSKMDISLQNIADATEQLAEFVMKYSETNKGTQFGNVVVRLASLRGVLITSSQELNTMQNDVVAYQNKVFRYEEMTESATVPNPYLVQQVNISVDVSSVQFNLAEMISLSGVLKSYSERIYYHTTNLIDSKEQISSVWRDSQFTIFSDFIDGVCKEIIDALKVFDEYVQYLDEKIKELN